MFSELRGNENASTPENLELIEQSKLSYIDKHHLRLLAHCLFTFKSMAKGSSSGQFPTEEKRLEWCLSQSVLVHDRSFIPILLEQLSVAAIELESLARASEVSPLELTVEDLIHHSLESNPF